MAFPTVPTVAGSRILFTLNTAGGGTKTFPNLSSLTKNAGDLLIAIIVEYDGNSTNAEFSSWGGSFTEFVDQAGTATMAIGAAYKWSTGSETGTFTVATADTSTNDSVMILMSIPGAHASTPPEAGTMATGTAPDVGALDPAGWGAEDTLWIAVGGSGEDSLTGSFTGVTTPPTNYTGEAQSGITADAIGGVEASVAFRQLNASSENPGAWALDTSNARGAALLIAVRPIPSAISFDAQPGSYSVADGASHTRIVAGRAVNAALGAYALTGSVAGVPAGRVVSATPGAYALTGAAAGLRADRLLNAELGAYSVAGVAVTFTRGREMNALPGAYLLTGSVASLLANRSLAALAGSYGLAGAVAGLVADRDLAAVPGAYNVAGVGSSLVAGRSLNANLGAYTVAGSVAGLAGGRVLAASSGAYSVAGVLAALRADRVLAATPGVYLVVGANATLVVTTAGAYILDAEPGSYALAGAAGLVAGRVLELEPGVYLLAGLDAELALARVLSAAPAAYVVAGVAANLVHVGTEITEFPTGRAPVMSTAGVAVIATAGNGRILSADDPLLEVQ